MEYYDSSSVCVKKTIEYDELLLCAADDLKRLIGDCFNSNDMICAMCRMIMIDASFVPCGYRHCSEYLDKITGSSNSNSNIKMAASHDTEI